jgi:hypothetical protein
MSWLITGTQKIDPDALAYLELVQQVDGQALEAGVRTAVIEFVTGCKADGIWSAIKASCILAGARTRLGALTPLVGTAPTSFNFVDGDYNRKTGLVGDGSTKYLNSNRNNNADPQNSQHLSVYVTVEGANNIRYIGDGAVSGSSTVGLGNSNQMVVRSRTSGVLLAGSGLSGPGIAAKSRSNSTEVTWRKRNTTATGSLNSETPSAGVIEVFRATAAATNARLAFYSIGESLDLALLDARVTDLINAFDTAIPS